MLLSTKHHISFIGNYSKTKEFQDLEKIHKFINPLKGARHKNEVSSANRLLLFGIFQCFNYPSDIMASSVMTSSQICESTAASAL